MTFAFAEIADKYQGVAPRQVIAAVQKAATRTGVDFSYLMEKASTESSFDPKARAKGSTATGLFQFIESTWLSMVKEYGPQFGLGKLASQIEVRNGRPCVDNCDVKNRILNLRKNPEIAALMAGAYSAQNKVYLETHTDGDVSDTDLYLAHFLGPNGATKFINARAEDGDVTAAKLFPQAAHVNRNVFYDKDTGQPRTLNEIYDVFAGKFGEDGSATAVADASPINLLATDAADPSSAPLLETSDEFATESRSDADLADVPAPALTPSPSRGSRQAPSFYASRLSPASAMVLAEMQNDMKKSLFSDNNSHKDRFGYNA
jgi:hypothetical protein